MERSTKRDGWAMLLKYGLPMIAVAMLGFAVLHVVRSTEEKPAAAPPLAPPEPTYEQPLAATGVLEASTANVAVAAPLPGIVASVSARPGCAVAAGDPLFGLDDRTQRAELRLCEARLATARASLSRLEHLPRPEELPPSAARVREARALLRERTLHDERGEELFRKNLIGPDERDQRRAMREAAREQLARAEAEDLLLRAGAAEADRAVARARVAEAEALVQQVQTELDRLTVRAPVGGTLLQVNVRVGESVGARASPPPVVLGRTRPLHLRVDLDEQHIVRFRPEAPATASRRGAPHPTFPLRFVRVEPLVVLRRALTGDVSERTDARVLQILYELDPGEERLYVGQQMDVFIAGDPVRP